MVYQLKSFMYGWHSLFTSGLTVVKKSSLQSPSLTTIYPSYQTNSGPSYQTSIYYPPCGPIIIIHIRPVFSRRIRPIFILRSSPVFIIHFRQITRQAQAPAQKLKTLGPVIGRLNMTFIVHHIRHRPVLFLIDSPCLTIIVTKMVVSSARHNDMIAVRV